MTGVTIKAPKVQSDEGSDRAVVVKTIQISEDKNSLAFTYRKDRTGAIRCTGFDVKVYGEQSGVIKSKADQLIIAGIERLNNPIPKGE
jgi:hypothetical protein